MGKRQNAILPFSSFSMAQHPSPLIILWGSTSMCCGTSELIRVSLSLFDEGNFIQKGSD